MGLVSPPKGNAVGHDIQSILDQNGNEGWELVTVLLLDNGEEVGYFKREKI